MKTDAVSPVIGVLLMLTLTLIIAAIVNSYAGGLMDTEPKAPSVTLQVKYSQSNGMEIRHVSGDPLPTAALKILLRPSETMGRNASQSASEIDKKYITDKPDSSNSWASVITSFKVGDVGYITKSNIDQIQAGISDQFLINKNETSGVNNRGNTFFLEVYYKNTMISRNEVLIEV